MDEAKDWLRVTGTAEDNLILDLIASARQECENYTHVQLLTATYDVFFTEWCDEFEIPRPPLQSITSVNYTDTAGAEQTVNSSLYTVDTSETPGKVRLAYNQSWPSGKRGFPNSIRIRFVAGYLSPALVPTQLKSGMALAIGELYHHREESLQGVGVGSVNSFRSARRMWSDYRVHYF